MVFLHESVGVTENKPLYLKTMNGTIFTCSQTLTTIKCLCAIVERQQASQLQQNFIFASRGKNCLVQLFFPCSTGWILHSLQDNAIPTIKHTLEKTERRSIQGLSSQPLLDWHMLRRCSTPSSFKGELKTFHFSKYFIPI